MKSDCEVRCSKMYLESQHLEGHGCKRGGIESLRQTGLHSRNPLLKQRSKLNVVNFYKMWPLKNFLVHKLNKKDVDYNIFSTL